MKKELGEDHCSPNGSKNPCPAAEAHGNANNNALAAGIPLSDLDKAQHNLKHEGLHTFADIALTDDQRAVLGFGTRSGSAPW